MKPRISRLSIFLVLVQLPNCAALLTAQAPTIDFVGDIRSGLPINVAGTVGDVLHVSFNPDPNALKVDCGPKFNTLTPLNLDNGAGGSAESINITTSPQSVALKSPPDKFTAGVQVCLRVDHKKDAMGPTTDYSPPKVLLKAVAGVAFLQQPASGANSISIQVSTDPSNLPSDLFVYDLPPAYSMSAAAAGDCTVDGKQTALQLGSGGASEPISAAGQQTIQLTKALIAGDQLCLAIVAKGGATQFSALTPVAGPPEGTITLLSALAMNSNSVTFKSDKPGSVSVYLFGPGYTPGEQNRPAKQNWPQEEGQPCSQEDLAHGSVLPLVQTSTTASTSSGSSSTTSLPVTANAITTIALSNPLTANTKICLVETSSSGSSYAAFSPLTSVEFFPPGADYGRFGMGFVGGVIISNEEQSTASSTASQYLDAELTYHFRRSRPKALSPGLFSFLDLRSSTIPVATTSTTTQTPTSGSSTTPTLTQSLNALSSQQSIRVLAGLTAPFHLTRWYGSQWITLGPLAVGGFDTLLNPTPPSSPPSTPTTLSSTAANFSSVYNFWAGGPELKWVQEPKSTDAAPRTFAWFSATLGNYSNLPSFVCTATSASNVTLSSKFFSDPADPSTSCYVASASANGATSYHVYASRHLVPRLDIAGNLDLPNLPVVLGFDANLAQFEFRSDNLDIVNKPGNDVRIFVGLRFDIISALNKLGVPTK
jgi:hypothetical protein